jgi:cellulose synthase/poly-beta-1,6-N-acetylglucosamine synthase-like glycosyltransferase
MDYMMGGLSVVIPTHGRHDLLATLLESISTDAENAGFNVEVIIVDDSSKKEAERILQTATSYNAKVLHGVSHVGEKRNKGAINAAYDLILFLDSDVKIMPGTLRAHMNRLSNEPEDVAGCLGKVIFVGNPTYAWQVIESMQLPLPFSLYPDLVNYVTWGPTAHLSVRRKLFLQIGGFDTTMPRYGGEDVDLGFRLDNKGLRIATAPDAVAEHAIETWGTWRQNLHRLWNFGKADYYLLMRHPERSFYDFPTGPLLWIAQFVLLIILVATSSISPMVSCALGASVTAYHIVYALVKHEGGSCLRVHLLGPVIFWIMDFAKAFESVKHGKPMFIFQRIKFHDDIIALDWREIVASAWGITASNVIFLVVILLARINL